MGFASGVTASPAQAGLVALTGDALLVEALAAATEEAHVLNVVTSVAALTDHLMTTGASAALIDSHASNVPVPQLVTSLRRQFPDLVLVVAGTHEDQATLAPLVTDGQIYRFLHKPVSAQRVKLFVESALRRHDTAPPSAPVAIAAPASGSRGGSPLPKIAIGVAALLVVAFAAFWLLRKPADEGASAAGSADANGQATAAPSASDVDPATGQLLERADAAFAKGDYVEPARESAAALYRQVLTKSSDNARAAAGLDRIVDHYLGLAEGAILAEKLDEASKYIDTARSVRPDHPRVAFLTTQIGKERERELLTAARQAAASGNLGRAISVLESGSAAGSSLLGAAKRELEQQDLGNRAAGFLALAGERIASGALLEPAQDNAHFYLESARALDPANAGLRDTEVGFRDAITAKARAAIDGGELAAAELWIAAATENGVSRADVSNLSNDLQRALVAQKAEGFTSLAQRFDAQLRAGRLDETDGARALYVQMQASDAAHPQTLAAREALGAAYAERGRSALARSDLAEAERQAAIAKQFGAGAAAVTNLERDIATAKAMVASATQVVPASSLKRTRLVEPRFPTAAREAGQGGWVELEFTVTPQGTVTDVVATAASPAGVFEDAAIDAVKRWRFEPVERNGVAISQRAKLRLRFDVQ